VKRCLPFFVLFTFALVFCSVSSRITFTVYSGVIRVPQDYPTIQEAINAANPGYTILVSAGTYNEHVYVNKSLNIIGEGATNTTVWSVTSVFEIHADNVRISSLRMDCGWLGSDVALHSSRDCNISNNIMVGGFSTIFLDGSSNNIVTHNDVFPQINGWGILLLESDNNIIQANKVAGASEGIGIGVCFCVNNKVEHNEVEENWYGIVIGDSSDNVINSNVVENNRKGIALWRGRRNLVYHNNLINNPCEVVDAGENAWDNGAEGNYWSDYNGSDLNGDGVGDTYLPWQGVDYYPLMNPYWNPADVDHDLDVDLYDAVRVLKAYGSKQGHKNFNPHCDIAEPYGIIDLYDVMTVLVNYGKRYDVYYSLGW